MSDRHTRNLMTGRMGTGSFPRNTRPGTSSAAAAAVAAVAAANSSASGPIPVAASTNVRRNLFQSQLTRRPTGSNPAVGSSSASAATAAAAAAAVSAGLDGGDIGSPSDANSVAASSDIVVRDRNGDMELLDLPSLTVDDMNEMALDERQENENERQRLADTIKYHQQRTSIPGHPEELLEAIRASLRAKVSALSEDNWMYEPEDIPRPE